MLRALAVAAALCSVAACHNPGIDEGAATLLLLEMQPARDADGASIAAPIEMTFNETIARQSLAQGFSLRDAGGREIYGTFALDGRTVRFDPELPLRLGQSYQAQLGETLRGENGAALDAAVSWRFSTAAAKLEPAQKIGTIASHGGEFQLRVAIDRQARSWATWLEDTVTFSKQVRTPQPQAIVVAAQSADRKSWQRSHRVQAPDINSALAISCLSWARSGDGYLVWQQRSSSDDQLMLARYDARAQAWQPPQTLAQSATRELVYPRCALDPSRGLHVAWLERDAQNAANNVVMQRLVDLAQGRPLAEAKIALRSGGERTILALLSLQRAAAVTRVYFASEMLSTIWMHTATLDDGAGARDEALVSELSPQVDALQLAQNRAGATFILWTETETSGSTLWALSRDADKQGWSSPAQLVKRPSQSSLGRSQIAVDPAGDALVSWREATGSDWDVYHVDYRADAKRWGAPTLLASIGSAGHHGSAIGPDGAPLFVAVLSGASEDAVQLRHRPDAKQPWSAAVTLSKHAAGSVVFPTPSAASPPSGQSALWWYERKRQTRTVGGVVLQFFDLELWSAWYQPAR